MLTLSSLLGPAKPPVASREDVASAKGTYHIIKWLDGLVADSAEDNHDQIMLNPGERCLVCLEEYRAAEEIRQLANCSHVFHRECIDEVRARVRFYMIPC